MKLEQAIKTAIEFEKKVQKTYEDAAGKASDKVARKIFEVLAKEEAGHVAYLESRLKEWQAGGQLQLKKLDTAVPSEKRIDEGMKQMKKTLKEKKAASTEELELLQRILLAEHETGNFYKKMVGELDGEGQKLFARFVEIEKGHVAIVQAEIDSVNGLGFWFDFREFNLEGG